MSFHAQTQHYSQSTKNDEFKVTDSVLAVEVANDYFASLPCHLSTLVRMGRKVDDCILSLIHGSRRDNESGDLMLDGFRTAAHIRNDARQAAGHCFQDG